MANKITVKFEAQGARAMVAAIQALKVEQERLTKGNKKAERLQAKLNRQVDEYNKLGILGVRNNRNLGGSFSVLRSQLLLGSFAFGLLNASILKLGRAYGEQEQAEKRLAGLLGKSSDNLSEYAGELQKVTRFGDEETIAAMGLVAAYTEDERAIAQLTRAAQDLATVKGMDLKTATDMLSKSVFSSTNSMQRYGIQIDGTAGSSTRLNSALKTISAQMGGAAIRDSETYLGSIDQMNNAMGDLAEKIGEKLAPAIISVATTMKSFVESFDEDKMKAYGITIGVVSAGLIYQTRVNGAVVANRVFNSTLGKLGLALTAIAIAAEGLNHLLGSYEDSASDAKDVTEDLNFVLMDNINLSKEDSKLVAQKFMLGQKYNRLIRERNLIEANSSSLFQTRIGEDKRIAELTNKKAEAEKLLTDFQTRKFKGLLTEQEKLNTVEIEGTQQYLAGIELKNKADQADLNLKKLQASITLKNVTASMKLAQSYTHAGEAAADAARETVKAKIREIFANQLAGIFATIQNPFAAAVVSAGASAFLGNLLEQGFGQLATIKMEQGGYVGGRRHSQGGTIIEAERGEFVMSRDAVNSIGVNNLEAMNAGGGLGITVNISGNVMSDDFVSEELAEKISEAVRKGVSFGMS